MKCELLFLVLACASAPVNSVPLRRNITQCGYNACSPTDPDALNVHIVAHSHDDVGWLKTVDQYYYGSKTNIQMAGVQYIIDSVVQALKANPERKFIQVETAFLWKWWQEQTDEKRQDFVDLVRNGQLEIVGGAWSMNDEAAVHYHSTVDQFTFGLRFVDEILGKCGRPKIGWQIDPFGHTREMASIFDQLGFDALFFARLDWRDKGERLRTKTAELLWKGSSSSDSLLFTHALYNHYSPPPGFYFDVLSNDDPLVPNVESPEYNLDAKVDDFVDFVNEQSQHYVTNNIIITMGNDFTYQDAHYSFKNLDILIQAFRDSNQNDALGRRIKLFYSTPACYIKAVNEDAARNDIAFAIKSDDFIPYASDHHTFWSGYYTSRPTQKRFERQGNNLLQVAKQLTAFVKDDNLTLNRNLDELRAAMGIMQHHDAITGTEKQHVAQDYARIFFDAIATTHTNIDQTIPTLLRKPGQELYNVTFDSCLLGNVSYCGTTRSERFLVAIYNPLSRRASHYVRLPVDSDDFLIKGPDNENVSWQITPSIDDFSHVPFTTSKFDLVFLAKDLPPLGVKLFFVQNRAFKKVPKRIQPSTSSVLGDTEKIKVQLDPETGFTSSVTLNGLSLPIRQELMYYVGAQGNNMVFENRSSGAYIFRPDPKHPKALRFTDSLADNFQVYKGQLVDEVHQTFNEWNKQVVRVYKEENHVEFDWLVGPIDIESENISKEIISRFYTTMGGETFLTDSNGRELLTRRNDFRATYNYSTEELVAGNYYPVTSSISVTDSLKDVELAILTDRAQGGAVLNPGEIELMVHRRLLKDDAFGVGEALNEKEFGQGMVARGQHFLTFGASVGGGAAGYARRKQREIAQRKILSPWVLVAETKEDWPALQNKLNFEFAGLTRPLPDDVHILTLERWDAGTILLRLEHILEAHEDGADDVTVHLKGLFTQFEIVSVEETTLGANQPLGEDEKLVWNRGECLESLESCENARERKTNAKVLDSLDVILSPMQIRTFKAKITSKL